MIANLRCWLALLLFVTAHAAFASQPSTVPPFSVERLPLLPNEPSYQQRLRIKRLPAHHGYERGARMLLHDAQRLKAIGWAVVVVSQERELLAVVESLPPEAKDVPLRAGPMPERVRVGKTLGVVLQQKEPKAENVQLNLGEGDGVLVGDYYTVLGTPISDADASGKSLGRRPVGLVKVQSLEALTAVASIEQGTANEGAFVKYLGRNPPGREGSGARKDVTLLVMRFQGSDGALFSDRLIDTLQTKVIKGYKQIRIKHETTTIDDLDGTQSQIKALGRKHGADIVVWGSVLCTNKNACIRPRVTVVAEDAKGPAGLMMEEPDKEIARDELGKSALEMDKRVLGLASRIAGLALYEKDNYADAAWHFERAKEGSPEDAEEVRQPLIRCHEWLGSWKEAEEIASELIAVGKQKQSEAMEALGHYWLGRMQSQRGDLDGALRELREAEKKYRAQGVKCEGAVAKTMGLIADTLAVRGQLDDSQRIRREEELPIYQRLGDIVSLGITMAKLATNKQHPRQSKTVLRNPGMSTWSRFGAQTVGSVVFAQSLSARVLCSDRQGLVGQGNAALGVCHLPVILHRQLKASEIQPDGRLRTYHPEILTELRVDSHWEPMLDYCGSTLDRSPTMHGTMPSLHRVARLIPECLAARGHLDEALRILREEELPVYQKLGAIREVAVTMGKIADILADRGQLDEALRIRREEQLPVYQKLGARREVLVCEANMAITLLRRKGAGDREQAVMLLKKAQAEAAQMGLPEAQQIEQVLNRLNQQPSTPSTKPPIPAP